MNDEVVLIQPRKAEALKIGDTIYKSAFDWSLTEKDVERAAREFGETEEKKEDCLQKLKQNLSKETNVKYRQDDFYLLRFLRVRKYDVKKAHHNVKLFIGERRKHPDFIALPPELKSVLELNWVNVLPYADDEGNVMFCMNLNRWNPDERSFEEIMQAASSVCDLVSMNPRTQINGVVGIWDLTGLNMRYVSELLWNNRLRTFVSLQQNGYPWRIKKMILLNTNKAVRFLFNLVRPLLQKKIAERTVLLGSDMSELHQYVNPVLLPKRLKGKLEDEDCDVTEYVLDNLPYLRYERTFI